MIMAADKQRTALMNVLIEAIVTAMMIVVSIGDVCSGAVAASRIQTASVNSKNHSKTIHLSVRYCTSLSGYDLVMM